MPEPPEAKVWRPPTRLALDIAATISYQESLIHLSVALAPICPCRCDPKTPLSGGEPARQPSDGLRVGAAWDEGLPPRHAGESTSAGLQVAA